jgi:hypothetical protein
MFDDPPAPRATPPEDRSPRHYRELFDANPLPTWAFDRETLAFLEVNQSAIDHYGYSRAEFLAMKIADIRPPEDVQRLFEDLGELAPVSDIDTWRHRAKDGRIIHVSLRGKDFWFDGVAARLVVAHDITAQLEAEQSVRRLDAQLNQAQKLEAIGRLSGGMAHDFNNILTAVLGYAGFLVAALPPDGLLHEDALEIERAGRRGADLTRQLLAFSRKQAIAPTVLPLEDVIDGITSMLRRLLGEDVRLTSSSDGGPHMVKADRCQLEQVLLNLAVNARDAMPDGGDLRIETTRVDGDGDAGPHVALRVTDTGCGMDDDTRRQIFEPFFTSKEPGKGTGLGLSICARLVEGMGGRIDAGVSPDGGARFMIRLPGSDGGASSARPRKRARVVEAS